MKFENTRAVLARIVDEVTIGTLADLSKINRSSVRRHLIGERDIDHLHLIGYLQAVFPNEEFQVALVGAWLRDVIPNESQSTVLGSNSLPTSEVGQFAPGLKPETRARLEWLCQEFVSDPELEGVITELIDRMGYEEVKELELRVAEDSPKYEAKGKPAKPNE